MCNGVNVPHIKLHPQSPELITRYQNNTLSENPTFHDDVIVYDSNVGSWSELGRGTRLIESTFGDYSYTAGDVDIIYADVGRFCSIASHVRINPGNHPMWRVTQHHMTYRRHQYGFGEDEAEFFDWRREHRCTIGHDVWLGHGAIVMPGVSIGTGAVVGSGTVVTKDIEPYTIAVGVPAKPIRQRFSDIVIDAMFTIKWWDWDHETLKERFDDLMDVDAFVLKYSPSSA